MRRAVVFCRNRSQWWRDQAELQDTIDSPEIVEGKRAYALANADAEARLADHWEQRWTPLQVAADEFMRNNPMLNVANVVNVGQQVDDPGAEDANAADDNAAPNADGAENANAPIVEIELEEEDEYADDYDFYADEY